MPHVEVLVGSPSDLHFVWDSELTQRLDAAGITYSVSACSAHRNDADLAQHITATLGTTSAYVCAAGWAAALPGAVKAKLLRHSLATVFGIALPSEDFPDAKDAEISIRRLPPGIDVVYGGVGVEGFNAIAGKVIEAANSYDPANPDKVRLAAVVAKIKDPQFNVPRPQKEAV